MINGIKNYFGTIGNDVKCIATLNSRTAGMDDGPDKKKAFGHAAMSIARLATQILFAPMALVYAFSVLTCVISAAPIGATVALIYAVACAISAHDTFMITKNGDDIIDNGFGDVASQFAHGIGIAGHSISDRLSRNTLLSGVWKNLAALALSE